MIALLPFQMPLLPLYGNPRRKLQERQLEAVTVVTGITRNVYLDTDINGHRRLHHQIIGPSVSPILKKWQVLIKELKKCIGINVDG